MENINSNYLIVDAVETERGPALGHLPHSHRLGDASLETTARQHAHRLGDVRGAGLAHDVGACGELGAKAWAR